MIKLFFGIPVEAAEISEFRTLLDAQDPESASAMRWVEDANLHVTVRFLGAVQRPILLPMIETVQHLLQSYERFEFTVEKIAPFPSPKAKLLAALITPCEPLLDLHHLIDSALVGLGFETERRRYRPHITLAKQKHNPSPLPLTTLTIKPRTMVANELILYESRPQKGGSLYVPQHHFQFL